MIVTNNFLELFEDDTNPDLVVPNSWQYVLLTEVRLNKKKPIGKGEYLDIFQHLPILSLDCQAKIGLKSEKDKSFLLLQAIITTRVCE